jgi:hypothetical protein
MSVATLRVVVERYLDACRRPVILEPGQPPLEFVPGTQMLSERVNGLIFEAWNDARCWSRRIVSARVEPSGRLTLFAGRLGGPTLKLELADLSKPATIPLLRKSSREELRERLRYWLIRQYSGAKLGEITAGPDLEHSLSPSYPRALLTQGRRRIAAIAAPDDIEGAGSALTFGLIWLDYLRRREAPQPIEELALFLPKGAEQQTLLRLKWLDARQARFALFSYDQAGSETRMELADTGNIDSHVEMWKEGPPLESALGSDAAAELVALSGFEAVDLGTGAMALRINGLTFARAEGTRLFCGFDRPREVASVKPVLELGAELAAIRSAGQEHATKRHAWFARNPEAWIESLSRRNPARLDPRLLTRPVYGQVPSMSGTHHGILDLLAIDGHGRLAVLELKAAEDPDLPLQALDYWIRVEWHAGRRDFDARGYFRGLEIQTAPPRLLLVAPALQFHPTTETILRFFSPAIDVERIGVDSGWRADFRVVSRLCGAEKPGLRMAEGRGKKTN